MAAYRTAGITRAIALAAVATGVLLTAGCGAPGLTHGEEAVAATITIAPDIGEIFAPAFL